MGNVDRITLAELKVMVAGVEDLLEHAGSIEISANTGGDASACSRAVLNMPVHICRLVAEIMTNRDDLPDPPP